MKTIQGCHYFDVLRSWREHGHAREADLRFGAGVSLTLSDDEDTVVVERPGDPDALLPYVIGLALGEWHRRKAERLAGTLQLENKR
jgi:hypothetical protein